MRFFLHDYRRFQHLSRNFADGAGVSVIILAIPTRPESEDREKMETPRKRSLKDGNDPSPQARENGIRTGARHWGKPPLFPSLLLHLRLPAQDVAQEWRLGVHGMLRPM
jgi:hypothetical protein